MEQNIIPSGLSKNFENIKKINDHGIEYWEARELMPLLGYVEWRKFEGTIGKAIESCKNSNQTVENHFVGADKMVFLGSGSQRTVKDYHLSRYACYLIAQNGDSRKPEIALAQTYFAIQTRMQEISQQKLDENKKRIFIREEVKDHNKKLFATAHDAGVKNFGIFNNYGYLGLYGLTSEEIKKKKQIGEDNILDRAGSTELAANLFRITQTDEKIMRENIAGEERANTSHFDVGQKVRKTIKEIGGTMPENLPAEKHIREIKKEEKVLLKNQNSKKLNGKNERE